jgi:hypothetical protein
MSEKKKFKDTGVGKFLSKTAPDLLKVVGGLLPSQGGLGVIKNIIGNSDMPKADKETTLKMMDLEFKDVQNARDNETARDISEYSSFLSKNIHELIAIGVIVPWVVSWFVVTTIDQVQITGAVMLILGYLYGRTKPQS